MRPGSAPLAKRGCDANEAICRYCSGVALAAALPGTVHAATPTASEATPSPDSLATYAGLFAEGMVQQPSDIAIGPDGSVWVTDMATDQLYQFDADGKLIRTFGETGQGEGQFEFADFGAVGLDGDGNVYVLDTGNQRVQKFTPDLTFTLAWGENGVANGEFQHPSDIAVQKDGSSFVVDALSGRLQQFDSSGQIHAGHRPHRSRGRVLRACAPRT